MADFTPPDGDAVVAEATFQPPAADETVWTPPAQFTPPAEDKELPPADKLPESGGQPDAREMGFWETVKAGLDEFQKGAGGALSAAFVSPSTPDMMGIAVNGKLDPNLTPMKPGQSILPKPVIQGATELADILLQQGQTGGLNYDAPTPMSKGLSQSFGKALEGLTTPESIATLPLFEYKAGRAAILGSMALSTPDQIAQTHAVLKDPKSTPSQKWEALGDSGVQLAMTAGMALGMKPEDIGKMSPEEVAQKMDAMDQYSDQALKETQERNTLALQPKEEPFTPPEKDEEVKTPEPTGPVPTPIAAAEAAEGTPGAPKKSGSWTKWFPRSDEVPDVLDAIHEEGGIAAPSQQKLSADKGDYDGYDEAFKTGMATRLRRSDGGLPPDILMQALNEHHGFDFQTVDEMYDAVSRAAQGRQQLEGLQQSEEAQLRQEQEAHDAFEQAALKNRGRPEQERVAADAVPVKTMDVGDTFTLKGEPFTVEHYDAETDTYTVQDGRKFGRQYLQGESDFYPDKGSVRGTDPDWSIPASDEDLARENAEAQLQQARIQASAAGGAPQEARVPQPGPIPPPPTAAPMPKPRTSSTALPALPSVGPVRAWFQKQIRPLQAVFAPQSIDAHARTLANILRENSAKSALDIARADAAMSEYRKDFDRTPVAANWKYDPSQPLPRNYQFLVNAEQNRAALSPEHQQFARLFDDLFQGRIKEVQRLQPKALQHLITDYFPHVWKDPKAAADLSNAWAAKAPLHGDKSFLRQRSIPYILEGLKQGLVPLSDNPADLLLMKLHQMDKFILAERTLQEASRLGIRKYLPIGQRIPEGWSIYNDRSSTKYGPPVMTMTEAFDAQVRKGLLDFMKKAGIPFERVAKLGINIWGQFDPNLGAIKTRFGGPDGTIAHEIGHALDQRYGLQTILTQTHQMQTELTRLADLRGAGVKTSAKWKQYARQMDEKVANAFKAYMFTPELMQQKAPALKLAFDKFIEDRPELHDLRDIKPSLAEATSKTEIPLPGFTVAGHYILPDGAAQVLNNHLSPGLARFAPYRTLRAASNIMNAAQLGLSAFHLGFTSLDAAVSSAAIGLEKLASIEPKRILSGAKDIAATPIAPMKNYYLGKAVQAAMMEPGRNTVRIGGRWKGTGLDLTLSNHGAQMVNDIARLAVTGGLRATLDPFYATHFTRNMSRAFHEGTVSGYGRSLLNLPLALVEQTMRPINEFLVPRQKLGVFAQMAYDQMQRLGPGATHLQLREAMARAADSTENRMGQMTYDNLFYNKMVKDVALLGFRAYGWQLGKYREALGAVSDTGKAISDMAQLRKPEMTHRMAYAAALPMVVGAIGGTLNYLMSGQRPQNALDYFFPRSGKTDNDGRPQRLMLPSYLKDLISDWHDFPDLKKMGASFYHKLNPLIGTTVDLLRNRDFYDTEIRHDDDPFWKQQFDNARYVLKNAEPFAVAGAQRMKQEGQGTADMVLPFFGVVPAKKALTMTPAESKAAELIQNTLPVGARTQEQFDHSKLIKELANDLRNDPVKGRTEVRAAAQSGQLRATDATTITSMLNLSPLQYQVHKLPPDDAMRVWDLANAQERGQLREMLLMKISKSKALDDEARARYLNILTKQ